LTAVVEREESRQVLPSKVEAELHGVSASQDGPRVLSLIVVAEVDPGQVRAQPDCRPTGRTLASRHTQIRNFNRRNERGSRILSHCVLRASLIGKTELMELSCRPRAGQENADCLRTNSLYR